MPTPGPLELVIILVIALLILGPGRLPDVGASLGKSIREFRKASSDVQEAVKVDVETSPLPPAAAQAPVSPAAAPVAGAPAPAPYVNPYSETAATTTAPLAEATPGEPKPAASAPADSTTVAS